MPKILDPTSATRASLVKRLALSGLSLAAATVATLGLYGHHAETFHHDSLRLLSEIASAKGVQVTLHGSNNMTYRGVLLPKPTATETQLEFDGRLSYDYAGSQYNFTLLNDRAYVTVADLQTGKLTRHECIHPDNVPPVATLTDALKNGRVVDAVRGDKVTCDSGKMAEFDFAGEPYVLCTKPPTGEEGPGTVSVRGDDLAASLTSLSDGSEGIPSVASLSPPEGLDLTTCDTITSITGDASLATRPVAARILQRTQDAFQVLTGGRRLSKMAATECSCTGGLKKCLFVHGLGYNAGASTDTFTEYFGAIESQAKCCSSVKFVHIDTLNSPWYADASTEKVCSEAIAMAGAADKMAIENVAVVAHSMGNLIFQAALMNGKCGLAASSKYIALAGPMYGTTSASSGLAIAKLLPSTICAAGTSQIVKPETMSALLFMGLCPTHISLASLAFMGSPQSTTQLNALLKKAGDQFGKSVSSSLCGVSATGLANGDSHSKDLITLSAISGHASAENDGQVHFDSCRATVSKSQYSTSWSGGKFYKASINHLDATFRYGDGLWGDDRKPIKWFNCQF